MSPELERLVDKGRRSLAAARLHYEHADYDFAVSRAYYAMFYLATAMLSTLGKSYQRHSAVVAAFARELVKPGRFDARHHAALHETLEDRAIADYGRVLRITSETAAKRIEQASAFVRDAEAYLRRQREGADP